MSESAEKEASCSFCEKEFGPVAKLIPDCGRLICTKCYEVLVEDLAKDRRFKCRACGNFHTLPECGYPNCKQLPRLPVKVEKVLPPQAKELEALIKTVREGLDKLHEFDAREHVKQECERLELEVSEAAEFATKQIDKMEKELLKQIGDYRQRCLGALSTDPSSQNGQLQASIGKTEKQVDTLANEIAEFNKKWTNYFRELSVNVKERELEAALDRGQQFQARIEKLGQDLMNKALGGSLMQFNARSQLGVGANVLGELAEKIVKVIDIPEEPLKTLAGHSDDVNQVIFLSSSCVASCSDDKTVKVWETENGQELFTIAGYVGAVLALAKLSNGWLACGCVDRTIRLFDLKKRTKVKTLRGHANSIVSLKALKSGNLASCSADDTIKIWNPLSDDENNSLLVTIEGHGNRNRMIPIGVLSNDSLVACSRDASSIEESTLRVWDSKDGRLVKSLPTGLKAVKALAVLSNDQVAVGTEKGAGTIKIIDLQDDSKSRTKEKAHDLAVSCLLPLSNGNLVSSGVDMDASSSNIRSIKVWSLTDLALLQHIITDHSEWIRSLSTSSDGKTLATGSDDNSIKLWPISSNDQQKA